MIPPMYDSDANRVKYSKGCGILSLQAIKISGGTSPKSDSEARNTSRIFMGA